MRHMLLAGNRVTAGYAPMTDSSQPGETETGHMPFADQLARLTRVFVLHTRKKRLIRINVLPLIKRCTEAAAAALDSPGFWFAAYFDSFNILNVNITLIHLISKNIKLAHVTMYY